MLSVIVELALSMAFVLPSKSIIGIKGNDIEYIKLTELPILDRYSTGSQISKNEVVGAFINKELIKLKDETNLPVK